ncbi:hypothetical protein HU200_033693 [Digitaria exilis]|uniref:Wall-associated receptor kinase galacturonan-binding domain-containing protein n=1 Tax=Digitaria exilis TaxID=1010633 RepID=A0A835BL62_9POAL|nr:hypothetical protein HU200_033693 [Digitaria exilis]
MGTAVKGAIRAGHIWDLSRSSNQTRVDTGGATEALGPIPHVSVEEALRRVKNTKSYGSHPPLGFNLSDLRSTGIERPAPSHKAGLPHAIHASLSALLWICAAALAVPWLPGLSASASGLLVPPPPSTDCQRSCGGVDLPFPFGAGPAHCMLPGFGIECRDMGNGIRKPFLRSNVELLSISLADGQFRVLVYISSYCYDFPSRKNSEWRWDLLVGSPFTFSDAANKFIVVGCRTLAYIGDNRDDATNYMTGCLAMCDDNLTALVNGSCSGMGCCQTAIPSGLKYYQVSFDHRFNTSGMNGASPCSFAVLMESSKFNFSMNYVTSLEFNNSHGGEAPVVLDWVSEDKCEVASTKPGYACVSSNSRCLYAAGGRRGYICNCEQGYEGNPYVTNGCKGESRHPPYLALIFSSDLA